MAIVKHILDGHASQVKVMSKVDKGSTFSFRLVKGNSEELVEHDKYE